MKLPLVDEIREARRLAEESVLASQHLYRIQAALTSIAILERQVAGRPDLEAEVPGDDAVDQLREAWPHLCGGAAADPAAPLLLRLAARKGHLELARAALRPLSDAATTHTNRLHELQHTQRHALEAPVWSEVVSTLAALGTERDAIALDLGPLNQRMAMVQPTQKLIAGFLVQLDDALSYDDQQDSSGNLAWRAVFLARSLLSSLETMIEKLDFEIPLPKAPDLTEKPVADPLIRATYRSEVIRIRAELGALGQIIDRESAALASQQSAHNARHGALTQQILAWMG